MLPYKGSNPNGQIQSYTQFVFNDMLIAFKAKANSQYELNQYMPMTLQFYMLLTFK